jgi:hypothetical protein
LIGSTHPQDLWVSKQFLRTEVALPTTHRRVRVAETGAVVLNPLENAVTSIVDKNAELSQKIEEMRAVPVGRWVCR